MEQLIVKYLNNELSQEEWQELRQWLEKSDRNKASLNHLKSFTFNVNGEAEELEEQVWQELRAKLEMNSIPKPNKGERFIRTYWKVAAVLLAVAVTSLIASQFSFKGKTNERAVLAKYKEAPNGRKIKTKLPDGSLVTLNSGSRITFPDRFPEDAREVELSGEAFFEVQHNPNKPFYVRMNGDQVRVLGTSFNIRSYSEDSAVYVSVATGLVSYSIASGQEVLLKPDQMATYLPSVGRLTTSPVDRLQSFGWKERVIYFKSTPFSQVMTEIERWYGVDLEVVGSFEHLGPFSGKFENESLENVLEGLSYVYPFHFTIEDKKVTLNKI